MHIARKLSHPKAEQFIAFILYNATRKEVFQMLEEQKQISTNGFCLKTLLYPPISCSGKRGLCSSYCARLFTKSGPSAFVFLAQVYWFKMPCCKV
jgi:hypothetical protein